MPATYESWNAAQTLERLGGDEGLFHEIIEIFLQEARKQVASMREALARGDNDATERIAHTLKGELASELRTTRANWRMLPETAIWRAQPGYRSCSKEILKTLSMPCAVSWRRPLLHYDHFVPPGFKPVPES